MRTRQEAIAAGSTRYFTGIECPRGHIAERLVSTRACSECVREKKHVWNADNPDKANAQKRSWRDRNIEKARTQNLSNQKLHRASANARNRRYAETHREELRAAGLARRIANPEKEKARVAAWQATHPEKLNAAAARYRCAKLKQMPAWADQEKIAKVYALAARFRSLGCDFHVDHEIPLQGKNVCGLHVHNNLAIIEARRNRAKSNQF